MEGESAWQAGRSGAPVGPNDLSAANAVFGGAPYGVAHPPGRSSRPGRLRSSGNPTGLRRAACRCGCRPWRCHRVAGRNAQVECVVLGCLHRLLRMRRRDLYQDMLRRVVAKTEQRCWLRFRGGRCRSAYEGGACGWSGVGAHIEANDAKVGFPCGGPALRRNGARERRGHRRRPLGGATWRRQYGVWVILKRSVLAPPPLCRVSWRRRARRSCILWKTSRNRSVSSSYATNQLMHSLARPGGLERPPRQPKKTPRVRYAAVALTALHYPGGTAVVRDRGVVKMGFAKHRLIPRRSGRESDAKEGPNQLLKRLLGKPRFSAAVSLAASAFVSGGYGLPQHVGEDPPLRAPSLHGTQHNAPRDCIVFCLGPCAGGLKGITGIHRLSPVLHPLEHGRAVRPHTCRLAVGNRRYRPEGGRHG